MTNDGWGKLPTDGWGKISTDHKAPDTVVAWVQPKMTPEQAVAQWPLASSAWDDAPTATEIKIADQNKIPVEWPKSDGWVQTAHDEWQRTVEPGAVITNKVVTGWGVPLTPNWSIQAEDTGAISPETIKQAQKDEQEALATLSRQTDVEQRASVLNSLSGKRDEWVMETDGELNKREEVIPTVTPNVPTGFYIAYHTGKWLHAVLSGPYSDKGTAIVMADAAYARMTEDSVFKLAFENKFERNGIYIAEIPLSARRHGAYGVLA